MLLAKKDEQFLPNNPAVATDSYTIHERGFPVFKDKDAIVQFGKIMMSDKRDELISSLVDKGFRSRNYGVEARDSNSIYNQIFDANGFLQVSDIIIRITDNDQFLLTIK